MTPLTKLKFRQLLLQPPLFSLIGFFSAGLWLTISTNVYADSILIKMIDSSNCKLKRYTIEMPELSVAFSSAQINALKHTEVSREVLLDIPVSEKASKNFSYSIKAEYEDCADIVSQNIEVQRGYIIYENVYNNQITHQIRAK